MVLNIIVGLKDTKKCHDITQSFQQYLISNFHDEIGVIDYAFSKSDFDNAVIGKQFNVGIVLEKLDDIAVGQGAIKKWASFNPNMRIILVMDNGKVSSPKANGLYNNGYYDAIFMSDFGQPSMIELIRNSRTDKQAYEYYQLDKFISEKEYLDNLKKKETERNTENSPSDSIPSNIQDNGLSFSVSPYANIPKEYHIDNNDQVEIVTATDEAPLQNETSGQTVTVGNPSLAIVSNESDEIITTSPLNDEVTSMGGITATTSTNISVNEQIYEEENIATDVSSSTSNNSGEVLAFSDSKAPVQSEAELIAKDKRTNVGRNIDSRLKDELYIDDYLKQEFEHHEKYNLTSLDIQDNIALSLFNSAIEHYTGMEAVTLQTALTTGNKTDLSYSLYDFIDNNERLPKDIKNFVMQMFSSFAWSYDILDGLISLPDVNDIHVSDYNIIRVKKGNERHSATVSFMNEKHYMQFINNLEIRYSNNINSYNSLGFTYTDVTTSKDFILKVSILNNAVSTRYGLDNGFIPELIIRKYPKKKLTLQDMIGHKINKQECAILLSAIKHNSRILLCGPASCGSTTLLNAMIDYIPLNKNAVVVQKNNVLFTEYHPEISFYNPSVHFNGTTVESEITFSDLANDVLTKDSDYYILEDIHGEECVSIYHAFKKGCSVWANITANSAENALDILANKICSFKQSLSKSEVVNQLYTSIDYIVFMKNLKVITIHKINHTRSKGSNPLEVLTSK